MKAVRVHAYGPPGQLAYDEVARPEPAAGQVLVRVAAAGVNPADYKFRNGSLAAFMPLTLPFTAGMDLAGTVATVGDGVVGWQVGDRVMAMLPLMGNGAYAEYAAVPAEWCARIPAGLDDTRAAALPTPATTAIEWIEDDLDLKRGDRVLVTGAAGAVGAIACYVAKRRGAHVVAGIRKAQAGGVANADEVFFLDGDEALAPGSLDCIADAVGGRTAGSLLAALKPGGVLSTVATDPVDNAAGHDVVIRMFGCYADAARLGALAEVVARGELAIGQPATMPLGQAAQAHELLERGGAGKIVLLP